MTLDLLLLFIALGLMATVVILRRPVALLALLTVAQWYVGAELLNVLDISTGSQLAELAVVVGFRLSLPIAGLVLFRRRGSRPGALQLLLVVIWAIVLATLLLQLLLPVVPFGGGYFYNLVQAYQVQLLAGITVLSFAISVSGRARKK